MEPSIVERAEGLAARARGATNGKMLLRAGRDMAALIERVPDDAPSELSDASFVALGTLADTVAGLIDEQVEADDGNVARQQALAATLYELRRAAEELERWRRHYRRAHPNSGSTDVTS